MDIEKKYLDDISLYVKPIGKIDIDTASEFGAEINDEIDNIRTLIIDFEQISYISSIGLRVLLEFQKVMKEQGTMQLMNVQAPIMNIFKMTGFDKILNII